MSALKTKVSDEDVMAYLGIIGDGQQKEECIHLLHLMQSVTGQPPKMWGASLIGFDSYDYKRSDGKMCSWFMTGFGPRKGNISIYIMMGFDRYADLMEKLGKYKTGKGCLYVKTLADVDQEILKHLIARSYHDFKLKYGT